MLLEQETFDKYGYWPKDLFKSNKINRIVLQCDYCKKIFEKIYSNYWRGRKVIQKDCCSQCKYIKMSEVSKLYYDPESEFFKQSLEEYRNSLRKPCKIGEVYGFWEVIGEPILIRRKSGSKKRFHVVECRCKCGHVDKISENSLRQGKSKSCGCSKKSETSDWYKTKIYKKWRGMINRCYNPNSKAYNNYGRRGIKVCDEWKNSFTKYREWAENNGYTDNLTINRKNPDKDYCPENCEWVTRDKNSREVTEYRKREKQILLNHILYLESLLGKNNILFRCNPIYEGRN